MQHQPQIPPDHDADFFAWTRHQAGLLRSLGKKAGALPDGLDLTNVAEEIEDLGSSELNAVKSLVRQVLVHLIKGASEPKSEAARHWRSEASTFHAEISDHYAPSMRRHIEMERLWRKALEIAEVSLEEFGVALPADLPKESPFTLSEIVSDDFSFDEAVKRLRKAQGKG